MALEVFLSTCGGDVRRISIEATHLIWDLRERARQLFERPVQALVKDQDRILSPRRKVGDCITNRCTILVVFGNALTVFSNETAFAVVKADGSVVTWGSRHYGGDSTSVQEQLQKVERIYSTGLALQL